MSEIDPLKNWPEKIEFIAIEATTSFDVAWKMFCEKATTEEVQPE